MDINTIWIYYFVYYKIIKQFCRDIEPYKKNNGFLLHFPSKDLKQSSITPLNKYFEQQGISIDLYDVSMLLRLYKQIQVVQKEIPNLEKDKNTKEYVIGKCNLLLF